MKTLRLLALASLLWASAASATTIRPRELTCPVDGTQFKAYVLMSTNNFGGQDRDFYSKAVGTQPNELVIHKCPKCHYAGYASDFKVTLDEPTKEWVQKSLIPARPDPAPAWVKYELMAKLLEKRGAETMRQADANLRASWSARHHQEPQQEAIFQGRAAALFAKALEKGEVPASRQVELTYLVGELNRRLGRFAEALAFFDKAKALKTDKAWLVKWLDEQRALAEKQDKANH